MRMCNNRAVDWQDTSLEVTLDIAGNISFQSFLFNLEYFMLNSKYTIQTLSSPPGSLNLNIGTQQPDYCIDHVGHRPQGIYCTK